MIHGNSHNPLRLLRSAAAASLIAAMLCGGGQAFAQAPGGDAPAPPGTATAQAQAFAATYDEWKGLLTDLRRLRQRYPEADVPGKIDLRKEWDALVAAGRGLLPRLRATGQAAFLAAPNEDRELTRLLIGIIADENRRGDHGPADELAKALLAHDVAVGELFNEGGIAAFAQKDMERAADLLKRAENAGALSDVGKQQLETIRKGSGVE